MNFLKLSSVLCLVVCFTLGKDIKIDNTQCLSTSDSRCLDCTSYVDCSTLSPVIINCTSDANFRPCDEHLEFSPPAFCSSTQSSTNGNCFCHGKPDGEYSDSWTIYDYVQCSSEIPSYQECPVGKAYLPIEGSCTTVEECQSDSSTDTYEIPLSCRTKMDCEYKYGDYEASLSYCPAGHVYDIDDSGDDYCTDPSAAPCAGVQAGIYKDPYVCRVWHMCDGTSDLPLSTQCCAPGTVFDEVSETCVAGSCSPSGYCLQEYWYQNACALQYCPNGNEVFATDVRCSKYYFECKIIAGDVRPVIQECENPNDFFNEAMGICTSTC